MMTREEVRLRILELALDHGLSTDKVFVANEFADFVFDREPPRIRPVMAVATIGKLKRRKGR